MGYYSDEEFRSLSFNLKWVIKSVKFEVDEFTRKVEQIEAFKSNLLSIGNKEARNSFLKGIMNRSLGNFFGINEKTINEINLYLKNSSLISEEFFNNWNEQNFHVIIEIVKNILSNTNSIGSILKNNSLKISSLLHQSSSSLTANLIQDISKLLSSFDPKFYDISSISSKILNEISALNKLNNSSTLSSITSKIEKDNSDWFNT
jgi:hypothetical protein